MDDNSGDRKGRLLSESPLTTKQCDILNDVILLVSAAGVSPTTVGAKDRIRQAKILLAQVLEEPSANVAASKANKGKSTGIRYTGELFAGWT